MTMKNAVFWDVTPCGSCKNRCFASIIRVRRIGELGTILAVTSNRPRQHATRRNIPDDGILHSPRRENLKSYKALTGWAL
jgi:hypothetical protein